MGDTAQLKRQRERKWNDNPYCFWCGCLTVLDYESNKIPDNFATIDHIRSRFQPARTEKHYLGIHVLACTKCNAKRARAEELIILMDNPELLKEQSRKFGGKPASKELLSAQGRLCNEVIKFIEYGGQFISNKNADANRILNRVKELKIEYEKKMLVK